MAIGISGTNSNSSSVQVSVGPAGFIHIKDKGGIVSDSLPITDLNSSFPLLLGCFDPANRKCYSGGGTSATDFVSGLNYTITGNANSDTIYKSDNVGIIEITGGGFIKSNGSYPQSRSTSNGESNTIEFWFWPATGPTQEEAIFQLRRNNGGTYENGYSVIRRIAGNARGLRFEMFGNDGTIISNITSPTTLTNAIWPNTWNRLLVYDFRVGDSDSYILYGIDIISPYHRFTRTDSTIYAEMSRGTRPSENNVNVDRELRIGKAEGVTGTFHGKIGCVKIYKGPVFNSPDDPPEEANGFADSWDWTYYPLAPRYDQYL